MKVLQTGIKHCGKRSNFSLWAISPFPTAFSNDFGMQRRKKPGIIWERLKSRDCVESVLMHLRGELYQTSYQPSFGFPKTQCVEHPTES